MSTEMLRQNGEPLLAKSKLGLDIGAVINGRYEVTSALGSGGMGEVYEVVHLGLRQPFALKCLKEAALEDESAADRFIKEIRGLAAVRSEFVVAICDSGQLENGSAYFVMERLRGQDLRQLLLELGALAPARAIELLVDACLGLQAVHEAGLVHRDLKPENLFVTSGSDETERCKVLDFGIAKAVGKGSTKRHSLIGTLKYMAPEQLADAGSVDPTADIYSLGAIIYECLAGRPPHIAESEPELMFKIMNTEPAPLASLVPALEPRLCSVVTRALHKDSQRRYPSAVALAGALSACLLARGEGEPTTEHESPSFMRAATARGRPWALAGLAAGLLVGVPLGAGSLAFGGTPAASVVCTTATPADAATAALLVSTGNVGGQASQNLERPPERANTAELRRATPAPSTRNVRPTLPALDDRNPYE